MTDKTDKDNLYGVTEYFDRLEPSADTKEAFNSARDEGDLQTQLDVIWDMVVSDSEIDVGGLSSGGSDDE